MRYLPRLAAICAVLCLTCSNPAKIPDQSTHTPKEFIETAPATSDISTLVTTLLATSSQRIAAPVKERVEQMLAANLAKSPIAAIRLDTTVTDAQLLYELGIEAIMRGSMQTALYCFLRALQLDNNDSQILCKTGFALNYLARYTDAKPFLLRAVAIDSIYHEIHANLSITYENLNSLDRAIYEMIAALRDFPSNPHYNLRLAQLYLVQGDSARAYYAAKQARLYGGSSFTEAVSLLAALPEPPSVGDDDPASIDPLSLIDLTKIPSGATGVMILDSVLETYMQTLQDYAPELGKIIGVGGREYTIEQDFLAELRTSADLAQECGMNCGGDDGCSFICQMAQCNRDRASLATAAHKESAIPIDAGAVVRRQLADFMAQSYGYYYRHPDAADAPVALDCINAIAEGLEAYLITLIPTTRETIRAWSEEVDYTCNATNSWEPLLPDTASLAFPTKPSGPIDINACLVVICIGFNGDKVSLSGNLGFVGMSLEYDMDKKTLGFGAGPTLKGYVTGRLEFNTAGEVKITGEVQAPIGFSMSTSKTLVNLW
jgi:tetratricopeptide (TPR) repeat protein